MGKIKYNNILTKDYLYIEYIKNRKSSIKIANKIGCDKGTILNKLKEFNIEIRTISQALIGHIQSEESKIKRSITCKSNPTRYWLGKKQSKEHKQKVSRAMKGKIKTLEHIKNQADSLRRRKGGITPLHTLIRKCNKYRDWRVAVFERDNYICQECNIKGGNLEVHHLYAFSNILKDFITINSNLTIDKGLNILFQLSKKYKPFWNIKNGQTLCEDCHNLTKRKVLC